MSPEQAAANRALLTRLAKQANQRLVRLERAKAKKREGFLTGALNYAHRALGQIGRNRFEEHNKQLTDKQVSAALRRVSRFLNMPESTLFGQKVTVKALEKYNEAKRAAAGPGILGAKPETKKPITDMEKRRAPDQDTINYERYKQLTYRAMQTGIAKSFSYETIRQSIEIGVKNGFSDDQIMNRINEMAEQDDLTRNDLLDAFGDEAREAAEAAEAEAQFSKEELEKWKKSRPRRRNTEKVRRRKKSQPPRRK